MKKDHWFYTKLIKDEITNENIEAGIGSYYSGYYQNGNFEDHNVRYLYGTPRDKELSTIRWTPDKLKIGKYNSIASGVVFMMGGNSTDNLNFVSVYPFPAVIEDAYESRGETVTGNDVWLGMEAMIMPGVKIGHGSVVAARSVVTKDIPPYTIVGGNPARVIRKRFSDDEIAMLLEMKWWDWSEEEINLALPFFTKGVKELYKYWKE